MKRYTLSANAKRDLTSIWEYIAADNIPAANRYIDDLDRTCRRLLTRPNLGRRREEFAPGVRSLVVKNHLIVYMRNEEGIFVIRFIHAAQDIEAEFQSE